MVGVTWGWLALTGATQQGTASLEISVRATPTGGRPEKVMRHSFFLLRENLQTIEELARQQIMPPDLATFIDTLPVSSELKEWMKGHETVKLRGDDFIASLTVDDVMDVPEFRSAYVQANLVMVGLGFPKRKAKLTDREKNPEKWEKAEKEYWEKVRSYLILHPESKARIDQHLLDINAATEWNARVRRYEREVHQRTLRLVHSRFLVARAETDYNGAARFDGIPPGRYWLTNLWQEARAGDVRLQWALPVELRPGQHHYLELNNSNARFDPAGL